MERPVRFDHLNSSHSRAPTLVIPAQAGTQHNSSFTRTLRHHSRAGGNPGLRPPTRFPPPRARGEDALQVKLRAYLDEEMRKWEKTFPDELWQQFGRLTRWQVSVTKRPKYWGKLVMELVYDYLDNEVADWLRANSPAPRHGQNYHQWSSSQYGLKKLFEQYLEAGGHRGDVP